MENVVIRKPASFRLRTELLDALKVRAAECNRSLNNYVESILLAAVSMDEPNELTKSAIAEAQAQAQAIKEGRLKVTPVDTSSVDAMPPSLGL